MADQVDAGMIHGADICLGVRVASSTGMTFLCMLAMPKRMCWNAPGRYSSGGLRYPRG
ncbi:MAG: hypothetical protein ACLUMK_05095 [Christensenellales bacterium]